MVKRVCLVLSVFLILMPLHSSLALNEETTNDLFIIQSENGSLKLDTSTSSQANMKAIKDPQENDAIYIPVDMSGNKIKINGNDRLLKYDNNTFTPVKKVIIEAKSTKSNRGSSFSSIDIDPIIIGDIEKKLQKSLEYGYENATVTVYAPAIGTYSVTTDFIGYGDLRYKSVVTDYDSNGWGGYEYLVKGIDLDVAGVIENAVLTLASLEFMPQVTILQLFTFFDTNPGYKIIKKDFVQARIQENKSNKYTFMYNYELDSGTYDLGCIQDKSNIADGKKTQIDYYGKFNGEEFHSYRDLYFCPSTYDDWSASKLAYDSLHNPGIPYEPYKDVITEYQAMYRENDSEIFYRCRFYSVNSII